MCALLCWTSSLLKVLGMIPRLWKYIMNCPGICRAHKARLLAFLARFVHVLIIMPRHEVW